MMGLIKLFFYLTVVVIIIAIIVYIDLMFINPIYKRLKKIYANNKKKTEYKNKLLKKYKNLDNHSKKEIYSELLECKKTIYKLEKMEREEFPRTQKEKRDLLIRESTLTFSVSGIIEQIESKYGIKVEREYLDIDIGYLKEYKN